MADKLTLRGVKRIENYVEPADPADRVFSLKRPTTGKDQFTVKRWWTEQGARQPKRYINATCLSGTFNGTAVVLAVVSNQDTRLDIMLNDAGSQLSFGEIHSVERIAIFSSDMATLHYDYVIPKIPGVAVGEIAVSAIAPPAPDTTVDSVTVSGEASPSNGDTETYTVAVTGDATPYTYTWGVTGGTIDSGQGTTSVTITWGAAGSGGVSCQVGSTDANFDGNSVTDNLNVTIS